MFEGFTKLIIAMPLLIGLNLKAQIKVPIDTIKSDYVYIDPDYQKIIQVPSVWIHYANYEYSKDSLIIYRDDCTWKFNRGKTVLSCDDYKTSGYGRYKFRGEKIKLLAPKKLRKGIYWRKWVYHKIIKISKDYIITESNIEGKRIRHISIPK